MLPPVVSPASSPVPVLKRELSPVASLVPVPKDTSAVTTTTQNSITNADLDLLSKSATVLDSVVALRQAQKPRLPARAPPSRDMIRQTRAQTMMMNDEDAWNHLAGVTPEFMAQQISTAVVIEEIKEVFTPGTVSPTKLSILNPFQSFVMPKAGLESVKLRSRKVGLPGGEGADA